MLKDVRMQGFHELTPVDEARERFLSKIHFTTDTEQITAEEALHRTLSKDVVAPVDIPPFDRAAMDGYAVKAEDTFGASPTNPVELKVIGTVEIGDVPTEAVSNGTAIRISTGAPMPNGANAVVMVEHTETISDNIIQVMNSVTPWKNVAKRGEDISKELVILMKGRILTPTDLALLKSIGMERVDVYKKPKIAVMSTGNELMEQFNPDVPGKIVDSNRIMLKSLIKEDGGIPIDLGIAKDEKDDIKEKILEGLRQADVLMISGGTSVGTKDLVPLVVNEIDDSVILVHGVAITPGRPMGLAIVKNKPVLLFPGYPVAVFLNYELFARPLLQKLQGHQYKHKPGEIISGRMKKRISGTPGIKDLVRVKIEVDENGDYWFVPIRRRGAGILSSITRADALLEIPEDSEGFPEGSVVQVKLLHYF